MMTRKWLFLAAAAGLSCLAAMSRTSAEETASPPNAKDRQAAGDDSRPPTPPAHRPEVESLDRDRYAMPPMNGPMPLVDPFSVPPPNGPARRGELGFGGHGGFSGTMSGPGQPPPDGPARRGELGFGGHGGFSGTMPGPGQPPGMYSPRGGWESLEQNDPEMFKLLQADNNLDRECRELADQFQRAPKDQREAIKQKLEKAVTAHFEVRQQRRALDLKRLEEELKRLREMIDKKNEARQQMVNSRVLELLGEQDEIRF
jgi:hypothetical protein